MCNYKQFTDDNGFDHNNAAIESNQVHDKRIQSVTVDQRIEGVAVV